MKYDWKAIRSIADWYGAVDELRSEFKFNSGHFFNFKSPEKFKELGLFFSKFMPQSPTNRVSVNSPLGRLGRRFLTIEPAVFYSKPLRKPRQGDIIKIELPLKKSKHCLWSVSSHTCDFENHDMVTLLPVLNKDQFITSYHADSKTAAIAYTNIKNNQNMRYFPLPPIEEVFDESHVIDLDQFSSFDKKDLAALETLTSLTVEGHFYFKNRLILRFTRDVKDRDENRELGHTMLI